MVQRFGPLMNPGGAAISLTYIASERIIPGMLHLLVDFAFHTNKAFFMLMKGLPCSSGGQFNVFR